MSQNNKVFTHIEKGGEYVRLGTSSGRGQRKGDVVIVYRDESTGQIHHREPEDFAMRMKPITKPDVNAQLLAALEAHEKFWTIREAELGELSPEAQAVRDSGLAAIAAAKGAV